MKLRRESAENGDFSGPKGKFRNQILIEKALLSAIVVAGLMKFPGWLYSFLGSPTSSAEFFYSAVGFAAAGCWIGSS